MAPTDTASDSLLVQIGERSGRPGGTDDSTSLTAARFVKCSPCSSMAGLYLITPGCDRISAGESARDAGALPPLRRSPNSTCVTGDRLTAPLFLVRIVPVGM